jgi:hypothetical protein
MSLAGRPSLSILIKAIRKAYIVSVLYLVSRFLEVPFEKVFRAPGNVQLGSKEDMGLGDGSIESLHRVLTSGSLRSRPGSMGKAAHAREVKADQVEDTIFFAFTSSLNDGAPSPFVFYRQIPLLSSSLRPRSCSLTLTQRSDQARLLIGESAGYACVN